MAEPFGDIVDPHRPAGSDLPGNRDFERIGSLRAGDDGIAQGEMKKAKETAINMKKKGYSDNTIAELLEVGVNIVQQWVAGTVSLAK